MDVDHFRIHVVRDSLKAAGWWSQEIENLILATGVVESNLNMLVQVGGGPARGVFQIEKISFNDVISYIKRDSQKVKAICQACGFSALPEDVNTVIWNLRFAVLITRMFYYRIPDALPTSENALEAYRYYKNFYNSYHGAATEEKCLPAFKKVYSYKES